jgi:hypothetical protein
MRTFMFVVLMLFAAAASAQQLDLKVLDKIGEKAKSKTEINMDESMLKSASANLDDKKPGENIAKKSIEHAKGFVLRTFEFADDKTFKIEDLKPILDQLKAPSWKLFLRSKEDDELTEIWTHVTNNEPDGMLLISAERNELTVIYGQGVTDFNDLKALGKLDPVK